MHFLYIDMPNDPYIPPSGETYGSRSGLPAFQPVRSVVRRSGVRSFEARTDAVQRTDEEPSVTAVSAVASAATSASASAAATA